MPLHDWNNRSGWEGMHHLWITELLRAIKPQLPPGYRAYIGSAPLLAVAAPGERPDVGVRSWSTAEGAAPTTPVGVDPTKDLDEPDEEVAVATFDPETSVYVERHGRLIAAVELISPRNKDRPFARDAYLNRYLGYLLDGAHLTLVDVHPRPIGFSFGERIDAALGLERRPSPPPMAASYRVGEPAPRGGRFLAVWRRALTVGAPLPNLPLPLTFEQSATLDLEHTYTQAAVDAYLA